MSHDDRWARADDLFGRALEMKASRRATFLERECKGDGELRELVDRLLANAETRASFMTPGTAADLPEAAPVAPGTRLLDRYRLDSELGRGGMSVVYRAHDERLGRDVAIKMLRQATALDAQARERLLREARAVASLNHPHVVTVHDVGEHQGTPFLVLELVSGQSLQERPPLSVDEALDLALQTCDALEHAHARGIVHRDLKPSNLLCTDGASARRVKLADLGIALARPERRITEKGSLLGTPTYMSPEQAQGSDADARSDLYAMGVMLYEWTVGRPPFRGRDALAVVAQHVHAPVVPPRSVQRDLAPALEALILRLLAKEAAGRFANAAELRKALEQARSAGATSTSPEDEAAPLRGLVRGRLVARERELSELQGRWRQATAGHGSMVLIEGEPGAGKTRLARELLAFARLDGGQVLHGGCYEYEATAPYLPLVEALSRWAREQDDEALRQRLGDTASGVGRLATEIESRLGPFPDEPERPADEERLRLFDQLTRFLAGLAGERGLTVFIDDVQWADRGTLALLHYLLRQLREAPVLFVATARDTELDREHPLSRALEAWNRERLIHRLQVRRLERTGTAEMVATLLDDSSVERTFADAIHRETEGNPFFVEELVKALVEEGALVRDTGGWERRGDSEVVLPDSIRAAVERRLERATEPCVDALRTAAMLGKSFEFEMLQRALEIDEDRLLDALDEAVRIQLLAPSGDESFAFTHDKIREVLYASLNPIRRRRLHRRIGETLESAKNDGLEVRVQDLAYHFTGAADYRKGMDYAGQAARRARELFALEEALEMYRTGLDCATRLDDEAICLDMEQSIADVYTDMGREVEAGAAYEKALERKPDRARRIALQLKVARAYASVGELRGLEFVQAALAELDPDTEPEAVAQARGIEARYHHYRGLSTRALAVLEGALELAERADARMRVAYYEYLAGTYQHLARFEESDAMADRCIDADDGSTRWEMSGLEFLAENAVMLGNWTRARECAERELDLALRFPALHREVWARYSLANALHGQGHLHEALAQQDRTLELSRRMGEKRLVVLTGAERALVLLGLGRHNEAREAIDALQVEADTLGLFFTRIEAIRGAALVAWLLGEMDRLAELRERYDHAFEQIGPDDEVSSRIVVAGPLAEALAHVGRHDEAEARLAAGLELNRRIGAGCWEGVALRSRGRLRAARGDEDAARQDFDAAESLLEASDSPLWLARLLEDRAGLGGEGAARDAERARALMERCQAPTPG